MSPRAVAKIATATERYRKIFGNRYRLIRNEHRGMGSTDAPDGPYSIMQLADDLNGLLEHLDRRGLRVLAGGGMGSLVGIALAATYPEKVRSLVLGAPSVNADNFMRSLYYYWRDLYNVSPELWPRDITLSDYTREPWNERPEIIKKALTGHINDDPFSRPEIYNWLLDVYTGFDAPDYLPCIACPTLVVCGGFEDRPTGPEYAREVRDNLATPDNCERLVKQVLTAAKTISSEVTCLTDTLQEREETMRSPEPGVTT